MARSKNKEPILSPNLNLQQMRNAVIKLKRRIDELDSLDPATATGTFDNKFESVHEKISATLADVFGQETTDYHRYCTYTLSEAPLIMGEPTSLSEAREGYKSGIETAKEKLHTAIEMLQERIEFQDDHEPTSASRVQPALDSRKVFIVHGHDSNLKTDTERFVREIGLEPIVLHRQPDEGATIIEKFEKHSDVGYAFILLTPDEIAYAADQKDIDEHKRKIESRARPNVIFEFGYFVGKLGRSHVCCLLKNGVVVPSDLNGLVYKPIDQSIDEQALPIIRELKAAGYTITV